VAGGSFVRVRSRCCCLPGSVVAAIEQTAAAYNKYVGNTK